MGMGKSSLARRLYDIYAPEENVNTAYIHTAAFKSAMDASRQISHAMGIPARRSFQSQMDALEEATAEDYRSGRNVVLLLDDAQLMHRDALEVIHRLYNFEYDAKVVQTLAFGQQELLPLFESDKAVNARVFVRMALPPLTLPSALQMVLFRLQVAGRTEPLITDEAFELLYERSGGVPREIVRLCAMATDRLLQTNESEINVEIAYEVQEAV
jgi:general secretion pathway protein A